MEGWEINQNNDCSGYTCHQENTLGTRWPFLGNNVPLTIQLNKNLAYLHQLHKQIAS